MATMIPATIPEAPEADRVVFNLLRDDPATEGWVIVYGVRVTSDDQREREIDFLAMVPGTAILCLDVQGGGFEVKQGQWYALDSREPVDPPGRQAKKAMYDLDDHLRDRFRDWSSDAELPIDCVVLFTDTSWPSDLRPLAYPTVGLPDLERRLHKSLGKRLAEIAKEIHDDLPDSIHLDSPTIKDIQDYLTSKRAWPPLQSSLPASLRE